MNLSLQAVDAAPSFFECRAIVRGQRGVPRPVDDPNSANGSGNASDIGAFEYY